MPKKKKVAARKQSRVPKVRKILLPPDQVVRVVAPPGAAPVVAIVAENVIEIVPVPTKEKTWWQSLFG